MSKTITLPNHRLVNSVQDIQRGYYDRLRTFLATASDEQIETIKAALGTADTLGVFAIEQEQEAREQGFLGFQVKETEQGEYDEQDEEEPVFYSEPGL